MKKTILIVAAAFGFSTSYAQLTTRENDASVEKLGARPVAGDMGFTFAMPLGGNGDSNKASLFNGNLLGIGDVLTYKYYWSNDMVIRLGLRIQADKTTSKGEGLDSTGVVNSGGTWGGAASMVKENKIVNSDRKVELVPGIEKHFSAANIFDAYVGADLYLGLGSSKTVSNESFYNGDIANSTSKTPENIVGLGVVTGFNVFIAHLPISVGLEYGWNAKWTFGGKTKVEYESTAGSTSVSGEYITSTDPSDTNRYSKFKSREFNAETNANVRLVLNVYFGK